MTAIVVFAACSTESITTLESEDNDEAYSLLTLQPTVSQEGEISADSRAEIIDFPANRYVGVFLLRHTGELPKLGDTYTPFSAPDLNIKGYYYSKGATGANGEPTTVKDWQFTYTREPIVTFPMLFITRLPTDNITADVYAYSPWQDNVTDLRVVAVKRNVDFLWVEENGQMSTGDNRQNIDKSNKNLEPLTKAYVDNFNKEAKAAGTDTISRNYTIPLTFRHAMSLLRLRLKVRKSVQDAWEHDSTNVVLSKVVITMLDKSVKFYKNGTLDVITGEWQSKENPTETLDTSAGDGNRSDKNWMLTPSYQNLDFYLVPSYIESDGTGDDEEAMRIDITINGWDETYQYTITRKELRLPGEQGYGLNQGYRYIFSFFIENYLHLEKVLIDDTWVDVNYTDTEDATTGTNPLTIDI